MNNIQLFLKQIRFVSTAIKVKGNSLKQTFDFMNITVIFSFLILFYFLRQCPFKISPRSVWESFISARHVYTKEDLAILHISKPTSTKSPSRTNVVDTKPTLF